MLFPSGAGGARAEETTAREWAYDRQRIARLERVDIQPLQKAKGEILRALITANGGKMLRSQARKKMHLSESRFSELLATMGGCIEVRPYYFNRNQKVLVSSELPRKLEA